MLHAIQALAIAALGFWAALAAHGPVALAQEMPREEAVRAVMVFNFLRFTEFPSGRLGDGREIRLCIHARGPRQADALFQLDGRRIGKRRLNVLDYSVSQGGCHVLYVDSRQGWNAVADSSRVDNALTISAYPGFILEGGMIEMDVRREGAQFEINLGQGRRAGFHFAPELLRLARRTHE